MRMYAVLYIALAIAMIYTIGVAYDYATTHANPCVGTLCDAP